MPKAGSEYNELAQEMSKALEPNAQVRMGQWIEGPDGKREVDVEVRGEIEGKPFFLLVECKDWKNPVDIEEIDKIDSKRSDLLADRVMICSNSGFTKKALRKARRLEIDAVSVLASGNKLVKLSVNREYVAKALSVDRWSIDIFPAQDIFESMPETWDSRELYYDDLPLLNWLHETSANLLRQHEGSSTIIATYAFKEETEFRLHDTKMKLRGIRVRMSCTRKWLSQTITEDVSLGYYDWIRSRVMIPNNQLWHIGPFDQTAWKELSNDLEGYAADPEEGCFRLDITLMNPISKNTGYAVPALDALIGESSIELY